MKKMSIVAAAILILLAPLAGQSITVVSPNGGEALTLGGSSPITWTTARLSQNVKIILVRENGTIFGTIASDVAHDGSPYSWTVGQTDAGTAPAGSYKVRVTAMDGSARDMSDAAFALSEGGAPASVLHLRYPNGGDTMVLDGDGPIGWDSTPDAGTVDILLLNGGAVVGTIASGLNPLAGIYHWHVGDLASGRATARGGYRVRVQRSTGTPHDDSDGDFAISAAAAGHDFIVSDPVMENRGGGNRGFRVQITDLSGDYHGRLTLQQYCMSMGLGNAIKQAETLDLHRGVPVTVSLFDILQQYFGNDCGTDFRFDVNPDHDVAETNYGNNAMQKKFFWSNNPDGRFFSLRIGRNYTSACEACSVVIRPADVESVDGETVRVKLEIAVSNCGGRAIERARVRTDYSWYFRDSHNHIQQGETNVDLAHDIDIDPGNYRILYRTVNLHRYNGATLTIHFECDERGDLDANNTFHCHPNFVGF